MEKKVKHHNKGSQPGSRTPEQRRKNSEASRRYYEQKKSNFTNPPITGNATIGIVAPVAPESRGIADMTQRSIAGLLLQYSSILGVPEPKIRGKQTLQAISTGYIQKEVIIEEDEPLISNPVDGPEDKI